MKQQQKILIVSSAFHPEISPRSFRATELAKEFVRQGHRVTVITKYRQHDYSELLNAFPFELKMWEKAKFPPVPQFSRRPFNLLSRGASRFLSLFFEYPGIEEMFRVKKMLSKENGYDLMISFAVPYPVHWGVARARNKHHKIARRWVADCGDPYMGDILDSFRKPFYFRYPEKEFCRKADFITIPVQSAMQGYYPEFHHKIRIIPQGFDFEKSNGKQRPENEVPQFAYAGIFLKGIRDPGLLMDHLSEIDKPFKFFVFTNKPELLEKYKYFLNGKLVVSDYIPREKLMKILSEMDFLINFDNNSPLNMPSKLIDYAIASRPVLNVDKNYQKKDIVSFLNRDYSHKMDLPDPMEFHISNISRKFLELS